MTATSIQREAQQSADRNEPIEAYLLRTCPTTDHPPRRETMQTEATTTTILHKLNADQCMALWRAALILGGMPAQLAMDAGSKHVQTVSLQHVERSISDALQLVQQVRAELSA